LYLSDHRRDSSTHSHSVLLINTNISTDAYSQLTIQSTDILAVHFLGKFGYLSILNIYNNCTHNEVLNYLSLFLLSSLHITCPMPEDHMLWLGDFNCHCPMWELLSSCHLNSSKNLIQPLHNMLTAYDMELALSPGIPTLQTTGDQWTQPDNVWQTYTDIDSIILCNIVPSL
ncbi:hypothetical protein J132_09185, partial [Termitomyces sp. J132]